jgi:hypothetical protein
MPSAAQAHGASEAIAAFAAAPHAGSSYEEALRSARLRLVAARAALETPAATSAIAERALASGGPALRRAFVTAMVLAGRPETCSDAAIVAATLATGDADARDDSAACVAIAIGREVAARLQRALVLDAPWDASAVADRMGAAMAAARVAGLDAESTRHALGLAATQASGLGVTVGTAAGEITRGRAAADAVEGAALAREGITSAPASLEGRRALAALMASSFDEAKLCDGLGGRWISA